MTVETAVVDPDLEFIRLLDEGSGHMLKRCFQCGTCSATCDLSPDTSPFPRKEMAWAAWGMKERLLNDPDVWLCYQCNDCSVRCPRGARPGDVLAMVRREAIVYHAFPAFVGRWASQPAAIPLLLGIPAALLTLALLVRDPIQQALGWAPAVGTPILYAYSRMFPRWLLNGVFLAFTLLALGLLAGGVARLWRSMGRLHGAGGPSRRARGLVGSVTSVVASVLMHDRFVKCTESRSRYWSHLAVFFGFLALSLVTIWVISAPYNPLVRGAFIYPFAFLSPWKVLANLGGIALLGGCFLMIWDRMRERDHASVSTFGDWALIGTLILVVFTGFATEVLHYIRLEPHRHLAYFAHLVFVGALLLYLPYSKLAHAVYRTTALVAAEYFGRTRGGGRPSPEMAGTAADNAR
ncbi:MAG: quinone-interacting membrane-bound oxidoreductase complex subunit QmoC [Acidobacteriota bacterium]